eukprot:3100323-Lingulodinium_polyedra.AAC.1
MPVGAGWGLLRASAAQCIAVHQRRLATVIRPLVSPLKHLSSTRAALKHHQAAPKQHPSSSQAAPKQHPNSTQAVPTD